MPLTNTIQLSAIVERCFDAKLAKHNLTCKLLGDSSGARYLMFRRTDAGDQILTVPIAPIMGDISPLMDAVSTGITLLGGAPRG